MIWKSLLGYIVDKGVEESLINSYGKGVYNGREH